MASAFYTQSEPVVMILTGDFVPQRLTLLDRKAMINVSEIGLFAVV